MSSSAIRALRILEAVGEAERPPGATEIARTLKSTPGTVFRGLDALLRFGLIARYQASAHYVLGPTADRLRHSLIAQFRVREVALPYLRQIASLSGETTSLYVKLGWYALRIASVPGTNEITNAPPLGEAHPLGQGYPGNAILAFLPSSEISAYRAWAKRHALKSQVSSAMLKEIAKQSYAFGQPEFAGASAVSLSIRSAESAVASLAIEGPVFDGSRPAFENLRTWREIADKIESVLRAQPALGLNPFGHIDPNAIAL
ncbi:MAG TPA: helix-turn-helix domain-containing protein [Micropepsaceae bacterium]|jgi:DNA-binding IclR family transcriptional regulator|nr:helix-turn-helix domain-containing protein [Micropepsaceae bacterium]